MTPQGMTWREPAPRRFDDGEARRESRAQEASPVADEDP